MVPAGWWSLLANKTVLTGRRICLRPWQLTDAEALLAWSQNPLFQKTAGLRPYPDLSAAKAGVQQYQARPASFVIVRLKNNQPIGIAELNERGLDERSGLGQSKELGFLLSQEFWRQGYMTEALTLLLNYAFDQLDQREIWAGTFQENTASQGLLQKLGFHYVYQVDYRALGLGNYVENYYLLRQTDWQN